MAVLRAGNHGIVGQSSAKVIDGNLTLDNTSQIRYLIRTPTIEGNRKILTFCHKIQCGNKRIYM